jgi:hypothetical protein
VWTSRREAGWAIRPPRGSITRLLTVAVGPDKRGAPVASGALLSAPSKVNVAYEGALYLFKTEAQLAGNGYACTAAVPVTGTAGLSVATSYSGR